MVTPDLPTLTLNALCTLMRSNTRSWFCQSNLTSPNQATSDQYYGNTELILNSHNVLQHIKSILALRISSFYFFGIMIKCIYLFLVAYFSFPPCCMVSCGLRDLSSPTRDTPLQQKRSLNYWTARHVLSILFLQIKVLNNAPCCHLFSIFLKILFAVILKPVSDNFTIWISSRFASIANFVLFFPPS